MLHSGSRRLSRFQMCRVGTAGRGHPLTGWTSPLSRISAPHRVALEETISALFFFFFFFFFSPPPRSSNPAKWCLSPGALVLLLFFFLLFFFTDSGASASSFSSFKSPPLRSCGSTSCCSCSSAMISDREMKWRISCWEPPVVRAEKCAGGSWANNEPLDNLCATTWPEWRKMILLCLSRGAKTFLYPQFFIYLFNSFIGDKLYQNSVFSLWGGWCSIMWPSCPDIWPVKAAQHARIITFSEQSSGCRVSGYLSVRAPVTAAPPPCCHFPPLQRVSPKRTLPVIVSNVSWCVLAQIAFQFWCPESIVNGA